MQNNQDLAISFWKQGRQKASQGDLKSAIQDLSEALRLAPHSAHIRRSLRDAQCDLIPKGSLGAVQNLKIVKFKAQVLLESSRENWAAVMDVCERALALNPWDGELNLAIAESANKLNQSETATEFYERAAKLEPTSRKCLEAYARLLERQGKYDRSLSLWERVLDLAPGDETAQRQVDKLQATAYVERDRGNTVARTDSSPLASEDTMLEEGDTWTGDVPKNKPAEKPTSATAPKSRVHTRPQRSSMATRPAVATADAAAETAADTSQPTDATAELPASVLRLLQQPDSLVVTSRIREAVKVLDDAYRVSRQDIRIGGLLFSLVDARVRISVPDRIERYRHARKQCR